MAPMAAGEVTIGADVNGAFNGIGACSGGGNPANRPCTIVVTEYLDRQMTAPCTGTVTRFRLNGIPTNNTYRLRVVRANGDDTATGTATSAAVSIATEGVNTFATNLPIKIGEFVGVDFQDSTEGGLRYLFLPDGLTEFYFYKFPADGIPGSPTGDESSSYLFNADVLCDGEGVPPPPPGPPSNAFKVVSLKGKKLTLELASAGAVTVANPATPKRAKGKAKPKLLKRSSASGGPGLVTVPLKLTGAAKAKLEEAGKVKVKAVISFTPNGGATATLTKGFAVKAPKKPAK